MLSSIGTSFLIDLEYTSKNGTGTGEIVVLVEPVDKIPLGKFQVPFFSLLDISVQIS
jgi:hypothetical protein